MMTLISGKSRHIIFSRQRRAACHWHPASFPYMSKGVMQALTFIQVLGLFSSLRDLSLSLCIFFLFISSCIILSSKRFLFGHVLSHQSHLYVRKVFNCMSVLTKTSDCSD